MKRRVTIIIVFLLLGAIVNVAVAWGCVVRLEGRLIRCLTWGAVEGADDLRWEYRICDHNTVLRVVWIHRHMSLEGVPTPARPAWSSPPRLSQDDSEMDFDWKFIEMASGWPLHTLRCSGACDGSAEILGGRSLARNGIQYKHFQEYHLPGILPLYPIPTGFITNTLFYASLLWLLFIAPFAARTMLRRRRGLCAKCAYPIGVSPVSPVSPVCTECGAAVASRPIDADRL